MEEWQFFSISIGMGEILGVRYNHDHACRQRCWLPSWKYQISVLRWGPWGWFFLYRRCTIKSQAQNKHYHLYCNSTVAVGLSFFSIRNHIYFTTQLQWDCALYYHSRIGIHNVFSRISQSQHSLLPLNLASERKHAFIAFLFVTLCWIKLPQT